MSEQTKVLIVDDDASIEKMLQPYLRNEGFATFGATNGADALAMVEREHPDVILLDMQMPGRTGTEVLKELQCRHSAAFVMFLTGRNEEVDRILGLELGADDYVTKPFSPREVASRVKALLRRGPPQANGEQGPGAKGAGQSDSELALGDLRLNSETHSVRVRGAEVSVTPMEFRILEVLASQPGRVFSRSELLDRVNRESLDVTERSLDSHIANLRRKIEPGSTPQYIVTVYGFGYKIAAPERARRTFTTSTIS